MYGTNKDIKYLVFSFLVTGIFLLLLNIIFGTYFLDYEIVFNALFQHTFTSPIDYSWAPNVWFLTAPLISKLAVSLNDWPIYSIIYTIFNFYSLFILFLCIQYNFKFKSIFEKLFITLFVFALFCPVFISISNRSVATFLFLVSIYCIYTYNYVYRFGLLKLSSFILILIALALRFEMVLLVLLFAAVFVFLFKIERLKKYIFYSSLLTVLIFTAFMIIQKVYFEDLMYVEKAEHILIDRNYKYNVAEEDSVSILNKAIAFYIKDDAVFTKDVYKEIVSSEHFINYLTDFKYIQFTLYKIYNSIHSFLVDYWFLILFNFILLYLYYNKYQKIKTWFLFYLLFSLCFIAISTIMLFPSELFFIFFSIVSFLLFLNIWDINYKMINVLFFLFILKVGYDNYYIKNFNTERNKNITYYNCLLETFDKENKRIVYANIIEDYSNYSSRLFSLDNSSIKHYYLDLFFYNNYNFYKDHNKEIFGNRIGNLLERFKIISQNNFVFVSSEEFNDFYKKYFHYIHGVDIEFKLLKPKCKSKSSDIQFNPYQVVVNYPKFINP